MAYVSDVTIPDGYPAAVNEYLHKTWKIKNLGPCKWNTGYHLVFAYGGEKTNWKTSSPGGVGGEVLPGETIDITIDLNTPSVSGEYGAFFRMQNDKGVFFGAPVTIYIKVP
jgi:hypothetical protein